MDLLSLFRRSKPKTQSARKVPVAVFDIDGTVFRSSLLIELMEGLVRSGVVPVQARRIYDQAYEKWQSRVGTAATGYSYPEFIKAVIKAYRTFIPGIRRSDVWKVADLIVHRQRRHLYRYPRNLITRLKKSHFLLAISHSPYEAVTPFAKSLGFDKVYAQVYEVDRRVRYTGKVLYENLIYNKAEILRRAVAKENLTLKRSVGIGDTESDIAFLKMVERPIAFNPSSKLYAEAKKRGWEIVVERKDVVYKI